jgi:hypothetical protein
MTNKEMKGKEQKEKEKKGKMNRTTGITLTL